MSKATSILLFALAVSLMAYLAFTNKLFGRSATSADVIAITGGRLVQGTGGATIDDAVVVIENGRIAKVFSKGAGDIPHGAQMIDARGGSLMPGLIDSRVTLFLGSAGTGASAEEYFPDRVVRDLRACLYWGVTSVQSSGDSLASIMRLRDNEQSGTIISPRLRTSGPMLTAQGGYPALYLPSMVAQESTRQLKDSSYAREVITNLADQKVDALSIVYEGQSEARPYPKLALSIFHDVVTYAHELGLRVTVRVGNIADLKDTVRAGVDAVELSTDETLDDEALRMMRERGVFYISTLSTQLRDAQSVNDIHELVAHRDVRLSVGAGVRKGLEGDKGYFFQLKSDPQSSKYARDVREAGIRNLALAAKNGAKIVMGTGAGQPAVFYGLAIHDELRLLTEAGLTTLQAIEAATGNAAEYMGINDNLGTIEPGKLADIIVTDSNTLEDITRSRAIRYVIKGAVIVDREKLLK